MRVLAEFPSPLAIVDGRIHDFQTNGSVYHTVCFRQRETVKKIEEWLRVEMNVRTAVLRPMFQN